MDIRICILEKEKRSYQGKQLPNENAYSDGLPPATEGIVDFSGTKFIARITVDTKEERLWPGKAYYGKIEFAAEDLADRIAESKPDFTFGDGNWTLAEITVI